VILDLLRKMVPPSIKAPLKMALGLPKTRLNKDWSILAPIGPIYTEHVVLDVGAHGGWFFHCWQDWCPAATVHAFEPYPESFRAMEAIYGSDPRVTLNQIGIGNSCGTLPLKVMADSKVSNSFLAHCPGTWDEIRYRTGEISEVQVPVTTLDAYCARRSIASVYLMKIDVQGFELRVLQGAHATLAKTDHILVESAIRPLYEEAGTFTEVVSYLQQAGFHLMAIRAWHRGNHVLMETDMLFRRNDLAPGVDETLDRVMEHA